MSLILENIFFHSFMSLIYYLTVIKTWTSYLSYFKFSSFELLTRQSKEFENQILSSIQSSRFIIPLMTYRQK